MSAPVLSDDTRNPRLLTVLFWIGVALAPVAALILLVADGNGPLRFAAVLAILAVVLIGLSIALRGDGGGQAHAEELLDEIEHLRRELRGEIVAAAQRGNQALDQAQRAQETVAALRRRVDAAAAGIAASPADEPAGRARVPAAETYDEVPSGRGRFPAQDEPAAGWGRPTADRDDDEDHARRPQPGGRYGTEHPVAPAQPGVYGAAARPQERDSRAAAAPAPESAARPLGVVRHTETVHVTTRHTVVDGAGADPAAGNLYGGYAGRWSSTPAPEEHGWGGSEPEERPWSGYAEPADRGWSNPGEDRSWAGQSGQRDDRSWGDQREDRSWSGQRDEQDRGAAAEPAWGAEQPGRGRSYQPDDAGEPADRWSDVHAGDRWAAVRDDERGREVRVGERRAAVHHDGTGTEFRMEDRWASARRDEPRREYERESGDGWGGGWAEPESRPALPVGGVPVPEEWRPPTQRGRDSADEWRVPAQRSHQPADEWRAAEPEPERRRRQRAGEERYGYPPQDDVPRAGGGRSADRWR